MFSSWLMSLGLASAHLAAGSTSRHERPPGMGEAATSTVAAMIANAIYDATGARLRRAPFTPTRIREAIAARPTYSRYQTAA